MIEQPVDVIRLPILFYVGIFAVYVVCHVMIGMKKKELERGLSLDMNDEQLKHDLKMWDRLFKWFPAIAVIIIVAILYLI